MSKPRRPQPTEAKTSPRKRLALARIAHDMGEVMSFYAGELGGRAHYSDETKEEVAKFVARLVPAFYGVSAETYEWLRLAADLEDATAMVRTPLDFAQSPAKQLFQAEAPHLKESDITRELVARSHVAYLKKRIVERFMLNDSDVSEGELGCLVVAWIDGDGASSKWRLFAELCAKLGVDLPPTATLKRLWRRHRTYFVSDRVSRWILERGKRLAQEERTVRRGEDSTSPPLGLDESSPRTQQVPPADASSPPAQGETKRAR